MLCCKELWSIISGRSSLLLPEEIAKVLGDNEERFCNGLAAFESYNEGSCLELQKGNSSKGLDLVLKLSEILNLDAIQTNELFQNFVRLEFYGTSRQLQRQLEQSSFPDELVTQMVSFYFKERTFLLRCIKYIVTYSQHPECLFQVQFSNCCKRMVSHGFIDKIFEQLKERCSTGMIHQGIKGNTQLEGQFAYQGLLEQYELLQVLLLYYKDAKPSGEKFVDIARFIQSTDCGMKQADKRHLGLSSNSLLQYIGFCNCLILLEGLDLDYLNCLWKQERSAPDHRILSNVEVVKKLDELFANFEECVHQSPVLLAWALVRHHVKLDEELVFEMFGRAAVAFDVLGYLLLLLKWASSSLAEVASNFVKCLVCHLLDQTFIVFHVDSFSNPEAAQKLLQEVAAVSGLPKENPKLADKGGADILLESCENQFPLMLCSFLDVMASCIYDGESGFRVYEYLNKMEWITELFDDKSHDEIVTTDDPNLVVRLRSSDIIRYGSDSIRIPEGCIGVVSELPNGRHLIRWNARYSCWNYLLLELRGFVEDSFYFENVAGCAEKVSERLTSIFKLLTTVLRVQWEKAKDLNELMSEAVTVINRFSPTPSPPLELIGACLETLTVVAGEMPGQVIDQLHDIGFLPECNIVSSSLLGKCFSDIKLSTGTYGQLLANMECQTGCYPVTKSYLKTVKVLLDAKDVFTSPQGFQLIAANVVFIIKEIFSSVLSWRFSLYTDKDEVVELTLELFYKLLAQQEAHSLQSTKFPTAINALLCDGILNGEAGDTLLAILNVGVDFLNQQSYDASANVSSVQIVKLGLAVLDRLLSSKKQPDLSVLERKICATWATSHESQFLQSGESSWISNVAKYIFHEDDPKLATLAIVVLQRVCSINSVSIVACFGSDAFALRRAIVSCLDSSTKPIRLKVAILEFLTRAVEAQPGLLELFVNHQHQSAQGSAKTKKAIGRPSCLPAVLKFLGKKSQTFPGALRVAALGFLHALWMSRMDPVLSILRNTDDFWSCLVTSVTVTENEKALSMEEVQFLTILLKLLAMESYCISDSGAASSDLQGAVGSLRSHNVHKTIKHVLEECSLIDGKQKERTIVAACSLIRSWTEFAMVTSSNKTTKDKQSDEKRIQHFSEMLSIFASEVERKVSEELSLTLMVLARQWSGLLSNVAHLENELITLIEKVCSEGDRSLSAIQSHLFSALLFLSSQFTENADLVYRRWLSFLPLVCKIIQDLSMEVISCQQTVCFKRLLLMINLISIASRRFKESTQLLHIFEEYSIFHQLTSVLGNIKKEQCYDDLINAIFSLALVFARDSKLVDIILQNNFLRFLVVNWNWSPSSSPNGSHTECEHWTTALALVTILLKTSSHRVLDGALSFTAANRGRIIEATKLNTRIRSEALLKESRETAKLFLQLSYSWSKLTSMEPELMETLKFEAMTMLHTSVSFLSRPRLLQHIVEDRETTQTYLEKSRVPSPNLLSDSRRDLQSREDAYYNLDESVGLVQEMFIEIIAGTTGMIRNITPNLVESILDEGADLQNFVPTVQLSFSSPSLDELKEVSFGTFIASVNVCHKILMQSAELSTTSSLQETSSTEPQRNKTLRAILNFIIENSLVIMMSEASFYLRHQIINPRTKQFMKRELGSELKNLLHSISRSQSRKSASQAPRSAGKDSPVAYKRNTSVLALTGTENESMFEIAYDFACQLLK